MRCVQMYRHCSEIDISGLKDPRLHEQTVISALYNLGRLLDDDGRHQVEPLLPTLDSACCERVMVYCVYHAMLSISQKWCKLAPKLLLIVNMKSYAVY